MPGLDPDNWEELRQLGHTMLDEMFDNIQNVASGPVWQPMPESVRQGFKEEVIPKQGVALPQLYQQFTQTVLPYGVGNRHPRFMGWVHGGGTVQGMLAEMLAAGLNANLGGRNHAPVEVERMVIRWTATLLGFPETATGVLVTGSSMANFIAIITASRAAPDGVQMRANGLNGRKLVGYAAQTAHGCIARAFDMAGLGTDALRRVPINAAFQMDMTALRAMIMQDRAAGYEPFLVVGTAGQSIPDRLIRFLIWRFLRDRKDYGFTLMVHLAHWRAYLLTINPHWTVWSRPTALLSIFINGRKPLMMQAVFWSGRKESRLRPSRRLWRICRVRTEDWQQAHRGFVIWDQIYRVAFGL